MNRREEQREIYLFSRKYILPQKWRMLFLLILILTGVIISSILPALYGNILDMISKKNMSILLTLMLEYMSIAILSVILSMIEQFWGEYLSYVVVRKIKEDLFEKIILLECKELDKYNDGELMSRLNGDAGTIVDYLIKVITSILTFVFNLLISLLFIFKTSFVMSTIALGISLLSVFSNYYFKKKYRTLEEKKKEYGDRYFSFQVEIFHNMLGVKSYRQEKTKIEEYKKLLKEEWKYTREGCILHNKSQLIAALLSIGGTLSLMYLSAKSIEVGNLTVGGMVSFLTYVSRLNNAINIYLSLNIESEAVKVCIKRIHQLEHEKDEREILTLQDNNDEKMISGEKWNQINITNLWFSYIENEQYILQSFSIHINGNGLYSIVGKNGCGKSSFLKILGRYYDYNKGNILVENKELREISKSELREKIVYIPKEAYIINETLIENIKIVNPGVSNAYVDEVIKSIGLQSFIEEFSKGYKTVLGENGKFLSSGQKQKLSVIRAVLCNPDIYLFDEITSDLDGESEREIMEILCGLAKTKIVLQIAHRMSSIINSKEIFVLDNKKIVAHGKHEDLLQTSEIYKDIFLHQQESVVKEIESEEKEN